MVAEQVSSGPLGMWGSAVGKTTHTAIMDAMVIPCHQNGAAPEMVVLETAFALWASCPSLQMGKKLAPALPYNLMLL